MADSGQPELIHPEQTAAAGGVDERDVPQVDFGALPMREDRTAAYRMLLAHGPVVGTGPNMYAVVSRADVDSGLNSPDVFKSEIVREKVGCPVPLVPVDINPPDHDRIRRVLKPYFSRAAMAELEPGLTAFADRLIDEATADGSCDVVADLAVPLSAHAFLELFGLPVEDKERIIAWKDRILGGTTLELAGPGRDARTAADELTGYLRRHLAQPGAGAGRPDAVLTQLLAGTGEETLSPDEVLGLAWLCVMAGFDTIVGAIGTAFARLAEEPRLRRRVAADPAVVPAAVEELVRLDPPAPFLPRVATRDTRIAGRLIPAGAQVNFCVGSANRDLPDAERPDEADFSRTGRNLSFGYGRHLCLGIHLARLELTVMLRAWHRRIPEYRLAEGARTAIRWPHSGVRIDRLPLVFPVPA